MVASAVREALNFYRSLAWSGLCFNAQNTNPRPSARRARRRDEKLDLAVRPRRNRKADWARRLVRENNLTVDDLIWPVFLCDGENTREPVGSMPGVERFSIDEAVRAATEAAELGIPALALFPFTDPGLRNEEASEALNPENLVCRACRAIKREVPDIGLITDVALDPYTSHGHDGILHGERILNDETVFVLVRASPEPGTRGCRYHRARPT